MYFINLRTPQPHVVIFKLAYQSRASKHKNLRVKTLKTLKNYLEIITKKVPPGARGLQVPPLATPLRMPSRSTKHVKMFLAYSQDFSKCCWRVKCGL